MASLEAHNLEQCLKIAWNILKEIPQPWRGVAIVGLAFSILLFVAPAFLPIDSAQLHGIAFLVLAFTSGIIGVRLLAPLVDSGGDWVASSALAAWAAASIMGVPYACGFLVTAPPFGEAGYLAERYGRFLLFSMPIGIFASVFVSGLLASRRDDVTIVSFRVAQGLSITFLAVTVALTMYVSSNITELGLASAPARPAGPVALGTMNFIVYPTVTLLLSLLLLFIVNVWPKRVRQFASIVLLLTGLWTIGVLVAFSFNGTLRTNVPGTGIGVASALTSLAVSVGGVAVAVVRMTRGSARSL